MSLGLPCPSSVYESVWQSAVATICRKAHKASDLFPSHLDHCDNHKVGCSTDGSPPEPYLDANFTGFRWSDYDGGHIQRFLGFPRDCGNALNRLQQRREIKEVSTSTRLTAPFDDVKSNSTDLSTKTNMTLL